MTSMVARDCARSRTAAGDSSPPPNTSAREVCPASIRRWTARQSGPSCAGAGGGSPSLVALGVFARDPLGVALVLGEDPLHLAQELLLASAHAAALVAAPWARSSMSWALVRIDVLASAKSWIADEMVSISVLTRRTHLMMSWTSL